MRDTAGNLPPPPRIFPDTMAPVARTAEDGVRELATMRWGSGPVPDLQEKQDGEGLVYLSPQTFELIWRGGAGRAVRLDRAAPHGRRRLLVEVIAEGRRDPHPQRALAGRKIRSATIPRDGDM